MLPFPNMQGCIGNTKKTKVPKLQHCPVGFRDIGHIMIHRSSLVCSDLDHNIGSTQLHATMVWRQFLRLGALMFMQRIGCARFEWLVIVFYGQRQQRGSCPCKMMCTSSGLLECLQTRGARLDHRLQVQDR